MKNSLSLPSMTVFGLLMASAPEATALQSTQFGSQQIITNTATDVADSAAADLDGDGDIDIVAAATGGDIVRRYRNNGDGTWSTFNLVTNMPNTTCVHVADMDGDGDMDILAGAPGNFFPPGSGNQLKVIRNNGNGTFTTTTINQDVSAIWDVTSADMDGDGDLDIVISVGLIWDQIGWFPNNGNLNFGGIRAVSTGDTTGDEPRDVHAADVDGDGDMDLLAANYLSNNIAWYRNNNGIGTSWSYLVINSNAQGARNVRTADMDGDGVMDIVTTSVLDRKVAWHKGLGSGSYGGQ